MEWNQPFLQLSINLVVTENLKKRFYSWSGSIYEFDSSRFESQVLFPETPLLCTKIQDSCQKDRIIDASKMPLSSCQSNGNPL